jgi:hypothetical protein
MIYKYSRLQVCEVHPWVKRNPVSLKNRVWRVYFINLKTPVSCSQTLIRGGLGWGKKFTNDL